MEIVYVQAVYMDNGEVIHQGKSLGFVTKSHKVELKGIVKIVNIK